MWPYLIYPSDPTRGEATDWVPYKSAWTCAAPITWSYDPGPLLALGGNPDTELTGIRSVLASLTAITGYTFQQVSTDARLAVAFVESLPWSMAGYAYLTMQGDTIIEAKIRYSVLSSRRMTPERRGSLYAHEFGHVLGLDHASREGTQVMRNYLSDQLAWGAGDLAGLQTVTKCR